MSNHIFAPYFNITSPGDFNTYTNVNNTTLTAAVTPSQDPATLGICLPRNEKTDQTLAPCIRVNGKLMPNPEHRSCRSFSKYVGATGVCRTTPPDACVELWESCPSGTGVLTSVVHTKSPQHIMQLMSDASLVPATFATNPYFDKINNYHSYTECYAIGNQFCEFPESKLLTASGTQNCYKDCPIGTTEDPTDQKTCTFNGSQIQCNPQYYEQTNTACIKKPLETQAVATCPANHETFINEQFTVEWCMPKCPEGFVHDVTYSSCIPLCRGSSDQSWNRSSNYSIFQDLLDYYANSILTDTTNQLRCGTYGGISKKCSLADQPGRCPTSKYVTPISAYANSSQNVSSRPSGMPVRQFNANSLAKKHRTSILDTSYQTDLQTTLLNLQNNMTFGAPASPTKVPINDSNTTVCPSGMVTALPNTNEKSGYCYDECPTGFNSADICRTTGEMTLTNSLSCANSDIQSICIADCPAGWRSKILPGNIQTCEYIYPNNKVPSDSSLFVPCPDNGTFLPFNLSDTTGPLGQSLKPSPPICVRKIFQRNVTCPQNHYEVNGQCIEGCQTGYIPIKQADGTFNCMQTCPSDNRMSSGMDTLQNPGLQDDAQCIRKPQTNGQGLDPVSLLHSQDTSGLEKGFLFLAIGFVVFIVLQRFFL